MARDISKRDIAPFLGSLERMYRAAVFARDASNLTVAQLRDIINQIQANYNSARQAWTALVALVGVTEARNRLAERIAPAPADVAASLNAIRDDALAVINAYNASVYATGTPAWTYSASLDNGVIIGGHTDANVSAGALSSLGSLCGDLAVSLVALAPE